MRRILVVISVMLLFACSATSEKVTDELEYGPRIFPEDTEKWTAIVAAYAPEIEAIDKAFESMDAAQIDKTVTIKGVRYQIGSYKGEPIVIFTTGISVPNAAMTMQMAFDYFPIDKVVMMGIAGSINPSFNPGDIAIPERWYFHDESVYVNPTPDDPEKFILPDYYESALARYKARELTDPHAPKYKNFGFIQPEEMAIVKEGWDKPRQMPYFEASANLLSYAKKAIDNTDQITMPSGKPIGIHYGGNGVTGSVFLDNAEYRGWLQDVYDAQVTEMESAAVGLVCFVNDVDWLIIRSISDLAGGQVGKNEENVFDAIASGTGTKLMIAVLDEMVKSEN